MNQLATIKAVLAAIMLSACFHRYASAEPVLIDLDKEQNIASVITPGNYKYLFLRSFSDTGIGVSHTAHMKGTEVAFGDLVLVTGIKDVGSGPFV